MELRNRLVGVGTAAAMLGVFTTLPAAPSNAAPPQTKTVVASEQQAAYRYPLKVTGVDQLGHRFTGTITKMRTRVENGRLIARGVIRTKNPATGQVVSTPFRTRILSGGVGEGSRAAADIPPGCKILHLNLAPQQLNLLGLVVTLPNPLVIDITAVPGGGLLGNLLCAVASLLDNTQLMNQVLNIISVLLNRLLSGLGLG